MIVMPAPARATPPSLSSKPNLLLTLPIKDLLRSPPTSTASSDASVNLYSPDNLACYFTNIL
ncbi:MAG TPA: hypothetical protein DCG72_13050 [Gammaproteobacteria bacterium]|nr:hypothetical protein [Gammaproteobacteria bacterium]